jgi:hypothetical protein
MTSLIWLVATSFPLYGRAPPSTLLLPVHDRLMHFFLTAGRPANQPLQQTRAALLVSARMYVS